MAGFLILPAPYYAAQVDEFELLRSDMVDHQIRERGIREPSILMAMRGVPRHLFVPEAPPRRAYEDNPVEYAPGLTLPQAYLSAQMIDLLRLNGDEKVLEIGTGSGYDAAILSRLASEVYTIEIDPVLGERAEKVLRELGYENVHVRVGDGYGGWPEQAPFDAILVTTAPDEVPVTLLAQLKVGGNLVLAVGEGFVQELQVVTKIAEGRTKKRKISPVVMDRMKSSLSE